MSSSAECATDDVQSSSRGSSARNSATGAVSAGSEHSTASGSSPNTSAALRTPPKRAPASAAPAQSNAGSGNEAGWMLGGGRSAPQPSSHVAMQKDTAKANAKTQAAAPDVRAPGPLAARFQDGDFEEITIDDLPQSLVSRHGGGSGGGGGAGKTGGGGKEGGAGGVKKGGAVISFGAGGIKMPANLAAALEQRRVQEESQLATSIARDFVGDFPCVCVCVCVCVCT